MTDASTKQCATHATEWRLRNELPCPWCVIDELKRARDGYYHEAATAYEQRDRLRAALRDYGQHQQKSCLDLPATETQFCYCGLTFAIAAGGPGKTPDRIGTALGCFEAALAEGWIDALANGDLERIRDLWSRRILFAQQALTGAYVP